MAKLTLNDLIARKTQSKGDKLKVRVYTSKSLEGDIELHKVDDDTVLDTIDMIQGEQSTRKVLQAYDYLIYNSVPMLKSKELLETYECVEPTEIVGKLFTLTERLEMGTEILDLCGFSQAQDEIKK